VEEKINPFSPPLFLESEKNGVSLGDDEGVLRRKLNLPPFSFPVLALKVTVDFFFQASVSPPAFFFQRRNREPLRVQSFQLTTLPHNQLFFPNTTERTGPFFPEKRQSHRSLFHSSQIRGLFLFSLWED